MNFLNVVFNSIIGEVELSSIYNSLWLMLKGMLGIFVVMLLIYGSIIGLGRIFDKKDNKN